ncbi:DUF4062 domain-containing protein [Viridibacillus arvi]|uniref:DUF4062 domain-containing protein n=1 Tax=Viridibacillus arvi TaxID=263475 RepID=UPI0036C71F9E
MNDRKYQVFISSTYTDLQSEREKVTKQILSSYNFPIGMEMFSAGDSDQWTVIKNTIDKSDYYVLILGHRYGSIADDGVSYTEKEYNYAKEKGIPILAFIKDRNAATKPGERESDPQLIASLDKFVQKAQSDKMCDFWQSEDELTSKVSIALYKAFIENPRIGWIRADQMASPKALEELTILSKENRELKSELAELRQSLTNRTPDLKVLFNNQDTLEVVYHPNDSYPRLDKISTINSSQIPEHLLEFIEADEIEEYNQKVSQVNESIEGYNLGIENYTLCEKYGLEFELKLVNSGQVKANNIYVDITFPDEVVVLEGKKEDFSPPDNPRIPVNPVEKAKSEYRKSTKVGLSALQSFKLPHHYTSAMLNRDSFINSSLRLKSLTLNSDTNNFVTFEDGELTIVSKSLMHTRERTFNDTFTLIPNSLGDFEIEINIICEEYNEPITLKIPLKITNQILANHSNN